MRAVTDRDLAMAAYTQGRPLAEIPVRSAMSSPVQAVKPETPVAEVERMLAQHQIRRVPVIDDDGRAVGMIGLGDLVQHVSSQRGSAVAPANLAATVRAATQARGGADRGVVESSA